ncbi:polyprenol monophosphomannose synthase [bacterium]|nr:polyprenol monophosphomannose synthase [bacterium]MCP5462841.1 polyprenol monophosphomannose synthase [bacterium]
MIQQRRTSNLVITATYNEAENIRRLITQILSISAVDILVIDDNSPDGTAQIVCELKKSCPSVHLILRAGKQGYGSAFVEGFRWGLEKGYQCIITMDADFSHDPVYISQMLTAVACAGVVIGSRYVDGGGTRNWGVHRKILSWAANIYSRIILSADVHDFTSGFRCYRREVLEQIDFAAITSNGYSFLEEILYECIRIGTTILEIPIIFTDRKYGKSKINKSEIFKAIIKLPVLRLKQLLKKL